MIKTYKLFRVQDGKLFPLYVLANKETAIHTWLNAECGEIVEGKVKSRLGKLALRGGWHSSELPFAEHIGKKNDFGCIYAMHDDHVWCECFINDSIDYTDTVNEIGRNKKGIIVPRKACLTDTLPVNGYYKYKTNSSMIFPWYISGELFVNRVLIDREVDDILFKKIGRTSLQRQGKSVMEMVDLKYFIGSDLCKYDEI